MVNIWLNLLKTLDYQVDVAYGPAAAPGKILSKKSGIWQTKNVPSDPLAPPATDFFPRNPKTAQKEGV
jgi:hypothetical protein